jgi:formylglycine-generating enzyme required for sulfatase activity
MQEDAHFICTACKKSYPEAQRFEDKHICQSCAYQSGEMQLLEREREERARVAAKIRAEEDEERKRREAADAARREIALQQARARAEAEKKARAEEERKAMARARKLRLAQLKPGITDADWAAIPAGEFVMGSPEDEEKRGDHERLHKLKIEAFRMLKTPVTFTMYDAFCRATGEKKPNDEGWGRADRPVIHVTYRNAVDYCHWLAKETGWRVRLPKEAEWEYACRAGTHTPFWNGESITTDQANYDGHGVYGHGVKGVSRGKTTPVRIFQPNPWGLYDMHGNVWEWCASEFDADYHGKEFSDISDDHYNRSRRVLRGGSWMHGPEFMRSANRYRYFPDSSSYAIGFRMILQES